MGMEAPPSWVSCFAAWTKVRAQVPLVQRKEESVGQVPVEGDTPGGMLSRVDVGAFLLVVGGRGQPLFHGPQEGWPLGQ